MPETVFVRFLEISATTSIIILGLRLFAPYLNKTYAAKWKYWIWLVLAIRLVIPINISLPTAPLTVNIPNIPSSDVVTVQPDAVIVPPVPTLPLTETAQRIFTLLDAFTMIWVIGIVAFMVYQLAGYFIFKKKVLRWSKAPQDPRVESAIHSASSQIGLTRKIIPLVSDSVSSPLMIGFFRPLLILPGETYSDADLSFIVRHELTHCKRNDLWYKLLLIIANAVHWYNPAAYLMFHEASGDLELSCDDVITNGMSFVERKVYTETILASIQQERMKKTALSTYFYGGQRTMKNRFTNILNTGKKRRGTFVLLAVLLCTALVGGLIACTADAGNNSADSVIKEYLEAEKDKDYVISLSIEKVEISNEETARIKERYSGSELANTNGWTDEYIAQNMIAVYAKYTVDYDNTKVPYDEGEIEHYFYLIRDKEDSSWLIWDGIGTSNQSVRSDDNYINSKYGFTFDIPSDWEDKYKVIEADETISFVYSEYEFEDKNYQEFFKIVVMSGDDYEKLLNDPPMTGVLLAEKGEQAYILYMPLDMAIMDSKKAEVYSQLFLPIDQIKERFYLVSNTDNTEIKEIGYIRNFDTTNNSFEFDEIEWITLNDTDRIKELNLNSDNDLPNGFYINNPTSDIKSYTVTDETEYQIIDWNNNGEASTVNLNGFVTHINEYMDYSPPFWIVIDNNMVISIVEQYIP